MVCRSCLNILFGIILLISIFALNSARTEETLFTTWNNFEADKCASIWLIKRFIAPHAEIRFYPQGELITEGVPFDTPDAKFRRYHNKSTFETLVEYYKLEDKKVIYIGKIIHDIEVNVWEKKAMPETLKIMDEVNRIGKSLTINNHEEIVQKCLSYFSIGFFGN